MPVEADQNHPTTRELTDAHAAMGVLELIAIAQRTLCMNIMNPKSEGDARDNSRLEHKGWEPCPDLGLLGPGSDAILRRTSAREDTRGIREGMRGREIAQLSTVAGGRRLWLSWLRDFDLLNHLEAPLRKKERSKSMTLFKHSRHMRAVQVFNSFSRIKAIPWDVSAGWLVESAPQASDLCLIGTSGAGLARWA